MQNKLALTAGLAFAIALVFSSMSDLWAASPFGPGSKVGTALAVQAQAKGGAGPGRCGTGKYWDRKKRACVSKWRWLFSEQRNPLCPAG
jgi:hypothetical protein